MDQLTFHEIEYLLHLLKQEAKVGLGYSDIENLLNGSATRKLNELKNQMALQFDE